eukprot:COSAG01_NODE_3852_length_5629_cov_3.080108_12_plen_91_part_00
MIILWMRPSSRPVLVCYGKILGEVLVLVVAIGLTSRVFNGRRINWASRESQTVTFRWSLLEIPPRILLGVWNHRALCVAPAPFTWIPSED